MTTNAHRQDSVATAETDVVIVGAGWAGMYALHKVRQLGLSAVVLEAAEDVGGTWYWNRYPGARCDVESLLYSYSFDEDLQQEWEWSERYSAQPELLTYARHVAERFDLNRDIRFGVRVESARFDEESNRWTLTSTAGEAFAARFCIMATGALSAPKTPELPGLDTFSGKVISTFDWPEDQGGFEGQRVAVVGTGSSGIQVVPEVANTADHLYVFQRTPSYSLPAHNRDLEEEEVREFKQRYRDFRDEARVSFDGLNIVGTGKSAFDVDELERERVFAEAYAEGSPFKFQALFTDQMTDLDANATAKDFVARKIAERVDDPQTARALTPESYPIATRRLCLDTDYYEAFNRGNVTLVDLLSDPFSHVSEGALHTQSQSYEVDVVIMATGFDAITGALTSIDIHGTEGETLREKWSRKISTYLGLMVHGYPNLFTVTGPLSPSVLSNMMVSIENHVEWISDCLEYLRDHEVERIEPTAEAESSWGKHVNQVAEGTLFPLSNSWYMGANVEGKSQQILPYLGGVGAYRQHTIDIAEDGYRGFALHGASVSVGG